MIKINDNWIDETEIKNIGKHYNTNYETKQKEYSILVNANFATYEIRFYSNEQLRDIEFNKLGELLSEKNKKQDDNKDYIQGFKDGTEYALKLQQNKKEKDNERN